MKVRTRPKPLTLQEWIKETGAIDTAKLLNVAPSTVRHWMRGYCLPRAKEMQLINKYSKGAVSYESMIDGHLKQQRNSI